MSKIAYLGWLGHANIGDEACYEYIHSFLPSSPTCWDITFTGQEVPRLSIVGGGTLLNLSRDQRAASLINLHKQGSSTVVWGTGVLQPKGVAHPEVVHWLKGSTVGVRGPRSLQYLQQNGVDNATVIGDPALLLEVSAHEEHPETILINVGDAKANLYGKETTIVAHLKNVIRAIKNRYKIVLFSMWPPDAAFINELWCDGLEIYTPSTAAQLMTRIAGCSCVIGMKLHSCVLSAAADVPFISIAYRDKCFDFAESLGLGNWAIRSDDSALTSKIIELVDAIGKTRQTVVTQIKGFKQEYKKCHTRIKNEVLTLCQQ